MFPRVMFLTKLNSNFTLKIQPKHRYGEISAPCWKKWSLCTDCIWMWPILNRNEALVAFGIFLPTSWGGERRDWLKKLNAIHTHTSPFSLAPIPFFLCSFTSGFKISPFFISFSTQISVTIIISQGNLSRGERLIKMGMFWSHCGNEDRERMGWGGVGVGRGCVCVYIRAD